MEQTTQNLFDLQIDHQNKSYLSEAAKWGKFLAIMGFIFCGIFIIVALFAGTFIASMMQGGFGSSNISGSGSAMSGVAISLVYIVIALVYFFPCLYLFHFSSKMQAALRSNQQDLLNTSFRNLKSCFKFLGILLLIALSFWVIALVIVMGAAIGGGI